MVWMRVNCSKKINPKTLLKQALLFRDEMPQYSRIELDNFDSLKQSNNQAYLNLDEVSRLHSHNQDILRSFANSRGFRIVFVTPEPIYAKPDEIRYYKFQRREDNRFEAISLNHIGMP